MRPFNHGSDDDEMLRYITERLSTLPARGTRGLGCYSSR
jgi:hypothetical protein